MASGGVAAALAGCAPAGGPAPAGGGGGGAGAGASAVAGAPAAGGAPPVGPRNVVLVHGAYADGSCWSDVIPLLLAAGVAVTSVQNPLTSLDADVAAVRRALDAPASAGLVYQEGFGGLTQDAFLNDFANGVPRDRALVLYAVQGRVAQDLFATRTTVAAWRTKPSRYIITTDDRTTAPELQRFVAKRMNATTLELASGHLSFVTHPQPVTQFILDAVDAQH